MQRVKTVVCVLAATFGVAACTDYDSTTNLNPAGDPMIAQVRMKETYVTSGSMFTSTRRVFGFGTHPQANEADSHAVATATASGNLFRVIMDELLVGNNLEEVACRAAINAEGSYSRVPANTTPDDIARCSSAQDVLPGTCQGEHAVCICAIPTGCSVGATTIAEGAPVGVLDMNQDGAADDTRLIRGAVGIQCGTIDVPIDQDMSYWNPSGNQQVPAMGGFEALGPAIVVVPQTGLPTNTMCQLKFDPSVVDKQGNQVCAPPEGDFLDGTCAAGDVSAFKFGVEALSFAPSITNGAMGVSRTTVITFLGNANLDATAITGVTITPTPPTPPVITIDMLKNIKISFAAGALLPTQTYTITLTPTVKDTFGQPLTMPIVLTFTTGA